MIVAFLLPELKEINIRDMWFQLDDTTAHTARSSMALLDEHFPERLIFLTVDMNVQHPRQP